VVALYRKLVVACGFITPTGYISYIATHPDWRGWGIASIILYLLIKVPFWLYFDVVCLIVVSFRRFLITIFVYT